MRENCPNCGIKGFFDGVACGDCGYGRLRSGGVITAKISKEIIAKKQNDEKNAALFRDQLKVHPISREWPIDRINVIAEIATLMGMVSADEWFSGKKTAVHEQ